MYTANLAPERLVTPEFAPRCDTEIPRDVLEGVAKENKEVEDFRTLELKVTGLIPDEIELSKKDGPVRGHGTLGHKVLQELLAEFHVMSGLGDGVCVKRGSRPGSSVIVVYVSKSLHCGN